MKKYLLIGNSKAAINFSSYLKSKGIKHSKVEFRKINLLKDKLNLFDVFFILTKDDKIIPVYKKYLKKLNKPVFHFSGCIYHNKIVSMHPIFSFTKKPIPKKEFEKIIFTSENPKKIKEILPWFKNKIIEIKPKEKPYYHSLLTIYFSFPIIMKKIIEKEMQKFSIDEDYLNKLFRKKFIEKNITITGPIIRNDKKTIKKHLKALRKKPFFEIYLQLINLRREYEYKRIL